MKKLIAVSLVAVLVIFASSLAQADAVSTQKDVAIEVLVQEVFGFSLWDADLSQSYSIMPGESAIGSLHITAFSNHARPWWIDASSSGMLGMYNGGTLPIKITTFGVGLTGTTVTDLDITASAMAIYTAGDGEYPKSGVVVDGVLVVPTTLDTTQDVYNGTITLTMTD